MNSDENTRETEPKKEKDCGKHVDSDVDTETQNGRQTSHQEERGQNPHLSQRETGSKRDRKDSGQDSERAKSNQTPRYNPVDTGWSWVILTSVFIIQFICAGFARAIGVVFVAIQMTFLSSASMIAVLGGVQFGAFSITALLCMSVVLGVLSVRRVTLMGAFIGSCGLMASFFATNVYHLIASLSVCIGMAMGLAIAPGFVLLNAYFHQKLPLATAVANTGASIGGVIMPIATRMLIDEYYLSGAFLFLGAIYAQMLVVGSLFTPPDEYIPKKSQEPGLSTQERPMEMIQQQRLLAKITRGQSGQRAVSESAVDGTNTYQESHLSSGKNSLTKSLQAIDGQHIHNRRSYSLKSNQRGSKNDLTAANAVLVATSLGGSHSISLSTLDLDANVLITNSGLLQGVFGKKDVNSGRCSSHSSDSSQESIDENVSACKMVSQKQSKMFDPSLFKSVIFWLLAIYHYTGGMVCGLPAAYFPALAQENGRTPTEGALLLTISGVLDILSRLVPGILAQSKWVKPQTSVMVSLLVLGVLFQFTAVVNSMVALTLMSVVYGLFAGVFFSMLPLLLLDFGGLNTFRQLFGFTQLSLGIGAVTGFPIVGYLRDTSGSYVTSFYFMGACGLVSFVLLVIISVLQRREAKRRSSNPPSEETGKKWMTT